MKVLVIGSGGREHALVWKCRQSPLVRKLYCAPGNGGIGAEAELVPIAANNIAALFGFAQEEKIDLTIVGPEQPLVLGIVDCFEKAGLKIWGPSQAASRLEGSKIFAKEFMQAEGIPTARFGRFRALDRACAFLETLRAPYVIKADGLAAGKGVVIAQTRAEAERTLHGMLEEKRFGKASREVVIEEWIDGEEVSVIALCAGEHAVLLASSQDHKRLLDADKGPNTGGMGAYSPAPMLVQALEKRVLREVIAPVLAGMRKAGMPYRGFLYAGLMIDRAGNPAVLEFNCRLGDPEAQALLFRLKSDLVAAILQALEGRLERTTLEWDSGYSACVVLASRGYPEAYEKGKPILGLPHEIESAKVFHAGTTLKDGHLYTSGGRILGVTAKGETLRAALDTAYRFLEPIAWDGVIYRRDIGKKGLVYLKHI